MIHDHFHDLEKFSFYFIMFWFSGVESGEGGRERERDGGFKNV